MFKVVSSQYGSSRTHRRPPLKKQLRQTLGSAAPRHEENFQWRTTVKPVSAQMCAVWKINSGLHSRLRHTAGQRT